MMTATEFRDALVKLRPAPRYVYVVCRVALRGDPVGQAWDIEGLATMLTLEQAADLARLLILGGCPGITVQRQEACGS
jgi:hypothetical protein